MRRLEWLRPGERVISDAECSRMEEAITRGVLAMTAATPADPERRFTILAEARQELPAVPPRGPRTGLSQLVWVACDNLRNRLSCLRLMKRLVDIEVRLDAQDDKITDLFGAMDDACRAAGIPVRGGLRMLDGGRS